MSHFCGHYREQLPHNVYIHPDAYNKTICQLTSHQPNIQTSLASRVTLEHIHHMSLTLPEIYSSHNVSLHSKQTPFITEYTNTAAKEMADF